MPNGGQIVQLPCFFVQKKNPTESWVKSEVVFISNCWFYFFYFFSFVFVVGKSGDDIFISYQHFRGKTLKRLCKSRDGFCA